MALSAEAHHKIRMIIITMMIIIIIIKCKDAIE